MMREKLQLSFSEISNAIKKYPFPKADLVIGVGRGGIVPASLVAHQLSADLHIVFVSYRDDDNQPKFPAPVLLQELDPDHQTGRILIVDDVSVSGKTLAALKEKLRGRQVETFVLKGKADHVLFPDINSCVHWPWKNEVYDTR
ncbi:MAG TPA: phosphoribosyltransferase [Cyclobacteriaceae bacterium]|nr:phosphoribosyltransferase [Cyclobacteriaceae bacterium]